MSLFLSFVIFALSIRLLKEVQTYDTDDYPYAIGIRETEDTCQNNTCGEDEQPHTLCGEYIASEDCVDYVKMNLDKDTVTSILMGHNGIRNKIAANWNIANVNLLHWSRDLAHMAQHYLLKCIFQEDICDYIVRKNLTVGQNFLYINSPPGGRWTGRVIRKWYREIGTKINSLEDFESALQSSSQPLRNFTQMIWPDVQFVGCAASRMFRGFMLVCYYNPRANTGNWSVFKKGEGCTKCAEIRPVCSRDFISLCGLDLPIQVEDSAEVILMNLFVASAIIFGLLMFI